MSEWSSLELTSLERARPVGPQLACGFSFHACLLYLPRLEVLFPVKDFKVSKKRLSRELRHLATDQDARTMPVTASPHSVRRSWLSFHCFPLTQHIPKLAVVRGSWTLSQIIYVHFARSQTNVMENDVRCSTFTHRNFANYQEALCSYRRTLHFFDEIIGLQSSKDKNFATRPLFRTRSSGSFCHLGDKKTQS